MNNNLNMDDTNKINKAINYLKSFEKMAYVLYTKNTPPSENDAEPFWLSNNSPPAFNYVYERGSVCVGLTNLVRRFMGLEIPGMISNRKSYKWKGDTSAWFKYLNDTNRLKKINFNKMYPKGTLLLQNYNKTNQGHVAITLSGNNTLMKSRIIHNINGTYDDKIYNSVVIEKLNDYPFSERFTHICLPQLWLLKN
jgi:hypothetical protein